MASSPPSSEEPIVLSEENLALRRYILNRPKKLNALNTPMLESLAAHVEHWDSSDLVGVIVGTGNGRAFCAGGDVAGVVQDAASAGTRSRAIGFFKREFGLNYTLAALTKPYVAIADGMTFGGGFGLVAPAPFRIATEKSQFAMPETKIGYCPDVGASYYLSRLDGEIGTYLGLTATTLSGRAAFEHGLATHYIPSSRVPILLERLAALERPTLAQIDDAIEELHFERESSDPVAPLTGSIRLALDYAFAKESVEDILRALREYADGSRKPDSADVIQWAKDTIAVLEQRSPTSLKVSLLAIRNGRKVGLLEALKMELGIATAFCSGATPDFHEGVSTLLITKTGTPKWSPASLSDVSTSALKKAFFEPGNKAEELIIPEALKRSHPAPAHFTKFALPTEEEIGKVVMGEHSASGSGAVTLPELITKFQGLRRDKHGVAEKIQEVVARRCSFEGTELQYLRWNH
ncbi:ClpP/crotonase [Auriscalpium vulgare]|uniref:ClpP/crotonase n=1 Tax=Auriscalpium vulgare TaxID=40419 RepID=A0ACB8SBM7_9AGAM|nr:ClpP/crotonase [Auriscalpium vulgare]